MSSSPPSSTGPLSPNGPITVTRDRWGIGHASAPDALSAFRAQGWLAATDRLWQMEWDRRRALGRWAEVAGPSAVAEDTLFRRIGLAARAEADWAALAEPTRAMTEAYAEGVNAALAATGLDLPPEFAAHPEPPAPWEPWHCVAVYQIRHFFMGTFHRKLWRGVATLRAEPELVAAMVGDLGTDADSAIAPGTPGVAPVELLADAEAAIAANRDALALLPDTDGASNSWAVHGSRTASGAPLLAGDPHRGIEFPNVYHQCHVRCPDFDAIGLAFPGVPGFAHFGHTERVAWCITHGMADDTDVFVETGPLAVERTETINVNGGEPVEVACASTDRGPVVLGDPTTEGPVLGLRWTAWHGNDTTLDALWPMLTASDVDGFEDSLRPWVIPVNNVLSVDVDGAISFHLRGRVVERPAANRWSPVAGDADHDWEGRSPVPFDDLHAWRNPERGFLVTANNRIGDDPPYISLDFAGPARHDRIVDLLGSLEGATVDDMRAIHVDTLSLVAPRVQAVFAPAAPATEAGRAAAAALAAWDGDVGLDSVGATVNAAVRLAWSNEVARRLGLDGAHLVAPGFPSAAFAGRYLHEAAQRLLLGDGWRLVPGVTDDGSDAVFGRLLDAVGADLNERLGPDAATWSWGRVHTMVSPHPLATARPELADLHPPVDPCAGDGDTVRCASVNPFFGDRSSAGSVARYVFDAGDWDNSGWVVPHGVSGVRGSGHDLDQRAPWLAGELVPMAYSPDAVAAVADHTFEL
ncbi:MAG: penicillin acylase family protein [Actinomycetota bacterium]